MSSRARRGDNPSRAATSASVEPAMSRSSILTPRVAISAGEGRPSLDAMPLRPAPSPTSVIAASAFRDSKLSAQLRFAESNLSK
jgi:hypothetical protein